MEYMAFLVITTIVLGVLTLSLISMEDTFFMGIICGGFFLLWGVWTWWELTGLEKSNEKIREAQRKRLAEQKAMFYEECKKNGINACDNAKEIQKATLIAQKMNLDFTEISILFTESKQYAEEVEQNKIDDIIEQERRKEEEKHSLLIQYVNYFGREKRIAMLSDEWKKHTEAADTLRAGANAVLSAAQFKEKEGDWAIMGGVASAIAGPAAGMATALNMQAKTAQENVQIRAQNQKNLEFFTPTLMTSYQAASRHRDMAKHLADEIDIAKTKLVSDDSISNCFERLCFDKTKVDISRTGTCTVTTTVSVEPFMIFDDVPAVIDGVITAQIYDDKEVIGTAQMVFPTYGLNKSVELTGMALFCGRTGRSYNVKFTSHNLWAMEK